MVGKADEFERKRRTQEFSEVLAGPMVKLAAIRAGWALTTVPQASTGPIRAWESGSGWFLAGCHIGTGERLARRAGQWVGTENGVQVRRHRGQCQRLADLTGGGAGR